MRHEPKQREAADVLDFPKAEAVFSSQARQQAQSIIVALRQHILRIEGALHSFSPAQPGRFRSAGIESKQWALGVDAIDASLPLKGLMKCHIHDVSPCKYGDFPSASGFGLALAMRRLQDPFERRPVLWCRLETEAREYGQVYGHGLEGMGLARRRLLTVTLKKPVALFWTMEEALKSGCLAVVIGDMAARSTDITTTRRLSLAAQAGKSAGVLVFTQAYHGATASHTRWKVRSARSHAPPFDAQAPGPPSWEVELIRARGGRSGQWTVSWEREWEGKDRATYHFRLVPGVSGGALHPRAPEIESHLPPPRAFPSHWLNRVRKDCALPP